MKQFVCAIVIIYVLIGYIVSPVFAQGFFDKECTECHGTGEVIVTCDLCNGTKRVSHTLTYQVLDYYEEKINAIYPAGVNFKVHIRIKNTDNYAGEFSIKETVNIGGHVNFETRNVYLSSQESKEIIFPSEGWYYAGFSTYSHHYAVTPPQVSITCPKCNGTGTITVICPVCHGTGYVTDWIKIWIITAIIASATVITSVLLIKRKQKKIPKQTI